MEKREPYISGDINWFSHYGKQYAGSSKPRNITEVPSDPAILILGIYLKKMKTLIQKDTCTSMLIAALFTTEKT